MLQTKTVTPAMQGQLGTSLRTVKIWQSLTSPSWPARPSLNGMAHCNLMHAGQVSHYRLLMFADIRHIRDLVPRTRTKNIRKKLFVR